MGDQGPSVHLFHRAHDTNLLRESSVLAPMHTSAAKTVRLFFYNTNQTYRDNDEQSKIKIITIYCFILYIYIIQKGWFHRIVREQDNGVVLARTIYTYHIQYTWSVSVMSSLFTIETKIIAVQAHAVCCVSSQPSIMHVYIWHKHRHMHTDPSHGVTSTTVQWFFIYANRRGEHSICSYPRIVCGKANKQQQQR